MRFLPKWILHGILEEGGSLSERRHDTTVVKTSARDEAQPAFVTRNVFGNRRQKFFEIRQSADHQAGTGFLL